MCHLCTSDSEDDDYEDLCDYCGSTDARGAPLTECRDCLSSMCGNCLENGYCPTCDPANKSPSEDGHEV